MKLPRSRKSPEGGCGHRTTEWRGPFDLKIGNVDYTYRQKWCTDECRKLLKNSKPKRKG